MNRLDEYSYPTSFDRRQWAKLWKHIAFLKKTFLFLFLAAVATAFFDALFPYFSRYAIDTFIAQQTTQGMPLFIGLYLLTALLQTGANDVYVVETDEGKEILLPAIPSCILDVDVEAAKMIVRIPEGLL